MMHLAWMLPAFFTAVLLLTALHRWFWRRLVHDPGLRGRWRTTATVAISLLGASLPLVLILGRTLPFAVSRHVVLVPYIWMGAMLLLATLLVPFELLWGLAALRRRLSRPRPGVEGDPATFLSRRQLAARWRAGLSFGLCALLTAFGVARAWTPAQVRRVEVAIGGWPQQLDGLRIVQLTDLHLGITLGEDWLTRIVARTNEQKPDLVVITGDLVDGSVARLRAEVKPLAGLHARLGVFFVTGNHEYYSGVRDWLPELARLDVRVLRNEGLALGSGGAGEGASFWLAGIDDFRAAQVEPDHGPDLGRALSGRSAGQPTVLLAHQPRAALEAAQRQVSLVLSGHTHGGQLWPWNYLVYLQQPFLAGLYRMNETTQVYVSEGTGWWGPPLRLGTTSEITVLELRGR